MANRWGVIFLGVFVLLVCFRRTELTPQHGQSSKNPPPQSNLPPQNPTGLNPLFPPDGPFATEPLDPSYLWLSGHPGLNPFKDPGGQMNVKNPMGQNPVKHLGGQHPIKYPGGQTPVNNRAVWDVPQGQNPPNPGMQYPSQNPGVQYPGQNPGGKYPVQNPRMQYPQNPGGQNPPNPGMQYSQNPEGENPVKNPGGQYPQTPGMQYPKNPGGQNPVKNPRVQNPQNPGLQYPQNPGGQNPQNPGMQYPQNPGGQNPQNPGVQNPQNPGGQNPQNPGGQNPVKNPGVQYPGQNPGMQYPQNPGGQNPQNSGVQNPQNPGGQNPQNTGGQNPQNPGGQNPVKNPGGQYPGQNPGMQYPQNPGMQYPQNPGGQNPQNSGAQNPPNPGGQNPQNPGGQNPVKNPGGQYPGQNPEMQYPQNPGMQYPQNPGGQNPQNSGGQNPVKNPGGQYPQNPGGQNPQNPAGQNPVKNPGGQYPGQNPGMQYPQNPGMQYPQNPGGQNPQNPGGQNPVKNPGGRYPQNPGMQYPQNPGGQNPQNPGVQNPQNPGGQNPQNPGGQNPVKNPTGQNPVESPGGQNPVKIPDWGVQHGNPPLNHFPDAFVYDHSTKHTKNPEYPTTPFNRCDVYTTARVPCGRDDISAEACDALQCCYNGGMCYFGKTVTVQCTKDAQFIVVVARDATLPSIDLETFSLLGDGPGCMPVDSNSVFAIYQFPVTTCGTVVTEEPGMIIYENRMTSSYEVAMGPLGAITRDSSYDLLFQCRYRGTSVETIVAEIFQPHEHPAAVFARGPISVQLRLGNGRCLTKGCDEEEVAYNSYYLAADYPVTRILRDPVYVEVQLMDRSDANLVLNLGRCWTTTSENPHSLPQWDILINGCPNRDDRYTSSLIPVGPNSGLEFPRHYRRFSFQMFTFVDPNSLEPQKEQVYIHCSTSICNAGAGFSCEPNCLSRRRRDAKDAVKKMAEPRIVASSGPLQMISRAV
ncbi:protein pygopus-like [Hippocampus zosterae]|uniref:protein pygopus-like n=1 Tax=Hippocampus zosterae TaxID=109293 RepID=UPI00223E5FDC|nr:protein pygopus-like [Hippocampus zosterae]